jgi:uncharacterized protein (TIGR02246 family)
MSTRPGALGLAFVILALAGTSSMAQSTIPEDPAVRELIARWNAAYRKLDARTLASLHTADVEIIDRFGHWVRSEGPEFTERLWTMTFRDIYKGKPGPERSVRNVRMLSPDVALVQATTQWDEVVLDDGTRIPPHGEIDTFVLVRRDGAWRVAAINIHNQMPPGRERPGERVPVPTKPPSDRQR